jgi:acyl-CoA thioesterase FadM
LGIKYSSFILDRKLGTPTAKTECEFLQPCLLGEILEIAVTLEKIGRSSLTLRFDGQVAGEPRMQARSVLVVIDLGDGRPRPIDDDLRRRMEAYQAG